MIHACVQRDISTCNLVYIYIRVCKVKAPAASYIRGHGQWTESKILTRHGLSALAVGAEYDSALNLTGATRVRQALSTRAHAHARDKRTSNQREHKPNANTRQTKTRHVLIYVYKYVSITNISEYHPPTHPHTHTPLPFNRLFFVVFLEGSWVT